MEKSFWIETIIVVIFLGITAGIIMHVYTDERAQKSTLQQANELNKMQQAFESNDIEIGSNNNENNIQILNTSSTDEKTTPNTIIVFENYYSKCGHSQIRTEKIKSEFVNENQEEFQKNYSDWKIKSFSSEKIELYKDENSICDNHYVVRDTDGYVTVYNINKDGQEIIRDKTDISTKYLPKDDDDLLQNGIKANSASQLEQILADFE